MAISNPSGNYIDKITLPTGTEYIIVDATARSTIDSLSSTVDGMSKYTQYLGVTTTALTDNETTTAVIVIGGNNVTATTGCIAIYDSKEFIYDGTKWQQFGDLSAITTSLGSMAYVNTSNVKYVKFESVNPGTANVSSTGSFTPSGTVSVSSSTTAYVKITSTSTTPANTATYWVYKPGGTVQVTPSVTGGSTQDVITGVTGITALTGISTAAPATAATFQYATVNNHVLSLNQITSSSSNSIASTNTANVVKTIGTISATGSFDGTTIYANQIGLSIPETFKFEGTAGNVTVTSSPVVTSVTSTTSLATVTIST